MILPCSCNHTGQDALNGPGHRVMNAAIKGGLPGMVKLRCTVCRKEHYRRGK